MDKKDHLLLGYILGFGTLIILIFLHQITLNIYNILFAFSLIFIFCLLPDIDHKSGTITWVILTISLITLLISYFYNLQYLYPSIILLSIGVLAPQLFKHRGFTHSLIFGVLVSLSIWYYFNIGFAVLSFVSFYSHLIGDTLYFKLL